MKIVFWPGRVGYSEICQKMERCVRRIKKGQSPEQAWYLEHDPVYTCGPKFRTDQRHPLPFPLVATQRGGDMTFHGPGQRVIYVLMDLKQRCWDIHHYIDLLEQWMIQALQCFSIRAWGGKSGRGLWTDKGKIASIGIKVTSGITWHGIACNIHNDLEPFGAIAPCGVQDQKMTAVSCFIPDIGMNDVDQAFIKTCPF